MKTFATIMLTILLSGSLAAQTDILDARTNFNIDDEVTVTGIVTNDGTLGSIRYIQDETAGIGIYPGTDWSGFTIPQIGDEITVTGTLSEFASLLEVGPDLTTVTINSSGNPLPTPQVLTPDEIDESVEGELISVVECIFNDGGIEISGNNSYAYISGSQGGEIYVRNGNDLVGEILPAGIVAVTGIASQYSFSGIGGYQFLPRNLDDFYSSSAINLSTQVEQLNITSSSFDLHWGTDTDGDSKVEYGLTPALGSSAYDATSTNDHTISLTDLEAGEIYYAKVLSVMGEDTAQSGIQPFATVSNSSGDIEVFFNQSVNTAVATDEEAISLGDDTNDKIAEYIMSAEHTLDICVYNFNNSLIEDAINTANANGVVVRYIAHGGNANISIGNLDAGISILYREDDLGSGMHNKFVIGDADYTDQAFVLTGSTNWTENNLFDDFNNIIVIHDESLAKGYRIEFEEMWGGSGESPNVENAKFGPDKIKNTPKNFIIDGRPVELYFSPTDNTTTAIVDAINTTEYDLDFALLVLTRDDIAEAMIDVGQSIFINPRGIIEQTGTTGSEYEVLLDAGIEVYSHTGIPGQLHHKYAIIDHSQPLADPMVITGSHNWSSSAESYNDENTLIVHDATVANLYYQEWYARYGQFAPTDVIETEDPMILGYPNPTNDLFYISGLTENSNYAFELRDLQGRLVDQWNTNVTGLYAKDMSKHNHGIYQMIIIDRSNKTQEQMTIVVR